MEELTIDDEDERNEIHKKKVAKKKINLENQKNY